MERQRDEEEEGGSNAKRARIDANIAAAQERLFSLARNGDLAELQTFVNSMNAENGERAALINAVNGEGWTILHVATFNYDISTIKWILSDSGGRTAGFNKVLAKSDDGGTALHFAVQRRRFEAFLAIVEGSKVENGERAEMLNAVDNGDRTVLHYAAGFGAEDCVNWLLSEKGREAGFNPEYLFAMTNGKESVLHLAVSSSEISTGCLDLILSQCRNAEERCRLLFGVDNKGRTVLHYAADHGRLSSVEWVVSHQQQERGGSNEDLFALTNDKESVLHFAARRGVVESFDFLLSRCNNISERLRLFLGRDDKGWTIPYHAARWNKGDLISHILRKYPEESKMIIDARDNRGMTSLHRAIIGGIDKESRKEWIDWHNKQAVVSSLLGLSYVEDEERGHPEKDAAALGNDEEDGEKKSVNAKNVVTIAAGVGSNLNVGLKFE